MSGFVMNKSEYDKLYRERDYVKEKRREAGRKRYHENKEKLKKYQKEYLARPETRQLVNERACKYYQNKPEYYMLARAKRRAKQLNLAFDLTLEDIYIPKVCPIFQIPLSLSNGVQSPNSPSLDKIDPLKGYIKGNVRVISNAANFRKSDMSIHQCERLLHYMRGEL